MWKLSRNYKPLAFFILWLAFKNGCYEYEKMIKTFCIKAIINRTIWKNLPICPSRNPWLYFSDLFLPEVGRVAQREKKYNQFYYMILLLGYKRNSKLPKMKWNLQPCWRAGGTQVEKSAKFGLNWLCVSGAISMLAQDFISLLVILSSFYIPKT